MRVLAKAEKGHSVLYSRQRLLYRAAPGSWQPWPLCKLCFSTLKFVCSVSESLSIASCKSKTIWATSNGLLVKKKEQTMTHLKEDPYFLALVKQILQVKRPLCHRHINPTKLLLCNYTPNTMCFIDLKAKTQWLCFITHITHNFPKLFFADSVMRSPWRAECWGPWGPLLESTEHLLPTAVRAAALWWRHRGTLCPPRCVTSIPGPWTKLQASRMGLACLLTLFSTSYMWRACGSRAECHRSSGTNGLGFGHGQAG